MSQEQWADVAGFEGRYLVSDSGRVRSLLTKKELRPWEMGCGYLAVNLRKEGKTITQYVHRIVASAFCERAPDKAEVNHRDANKKNNSAGNLEWVTPLENRTHAKNSGLICCGEQSSSSKLTAQQVLEIRNRLGAETQEKIAKDYGVHQMTISRIKRRDIWAHL